MRGKLRRGMMAARAWPYLRPTATIVIVAVAAIITPVIAQRKEATEAMATQVRIVAEQAVGSPSAA